MRSHSYAVLAAFKTLILPNIAALSDAQCAQLRAYVEWGGGLVAKYETSLYDEWGVRRNDFGLGALLGVRFKASVEGPMQNSYLRLETDPATGKRHPLLAGLEDAPRIINGVRRVEVEPTQSFPNPPLTLIPSYPDLPMERVYPRVQKRDVPQVYSRELVDHPVNLKSQNLKLSGRVVYFPWDIDRTFWGVLAPDHFKLLRNAVVWATNEQPRITVTGPAVSRKRLHLAWTHVAAEYPDEMPAGSSRMQEADLVYEDGKPHLANQRLIIDSRDLPFKCTLETQNYRPPDERELIFSAYGYQGTGVVGIELMTKKVVNYSNAPGQYDEPEGIFPEGLHTLVECDKQNLKGAGNVDLWKLKLDGSREYERLTHFSDYPGYKASNPVVSDHGRFVAFQMARSTEAAGVGHGIFVLVMK